MVVKLEAGLPRVLGHRGGRGRWDVWVTVGPSLGWMCLVVMLALTLDVLGDEAVVRWTQGLCPISRLPSEGLREYELMVQLVRGGALHAPQEFTERCARGETSHHMHVVGSTARSQQLAPEFERLAADDGEDALVERRRQKWSSSGGRPDGMHKNQRRRTFRHPSFSSARLAKCGPPKPAHEATHCVRVPLVGRPPTSLRASPPEGGTFRSPRPSLLPTA